MKLSGTIIVFALVAVAALIVLTPTNSNEEKFADHRDWLLDLSKRDIHLPQSINTDEVLDAGYWGGFGDSSAFAIIETSPENIEILKRNALQHLSTIAFETTTLPASMDGLFYDGNGEIIKKEFPQSVTYYLWFRKDSPHVFTILRTKS